MSEPLHDIDKLFHDSIEGHTEYPHKKVWEKVEAGLDKDTALTYKRKYKMLKRVAAALLFLFLGVVIYEIINRNSDNNKLVGTEREAQTTKPNGKTDRSQPKETPSINENRNIDQTGNKNPPKTGVNNDVIEQGTASPDRRSKTTSTAGATVTNSNDVSRSGNGLEGKSKQSDPRHLKSGALRNEELELNSNRPGKRKSREENSISVDNVLSTLTGNNEEKAAGPSFRPAGLIVLTPSKKNVKDVLTPVANVSSVASASVLQQLYYARAKKSTSPFLANRGFSAQVYFLPSTAWNELEDDHPHQFNWGGGPGGPVQNHNEIKKNERRSVAYSAGLKISYGLNRKFSIRTGLNYTRSMTAERSKAIYAEKDDNGHIRYRSDCSSGYSYLLPPGSSNPAMGDRKIVSNIRNILSYIGVPVEVEYKISSGKFSLSASTGAQANILLKGKTNAVFEKGTTNEKAASNTTEGLRATYFSALAGITGELHLNHKLSFTVTPTGQFGLSSINQGTSVKTRPNFIGLSGGLKLKL